MIVGGFDQKEFLGVPFNSRLCRCCHRATARTSESNATFGGQRRRPGTAGMSRHTGSADLGATCRMGMVMYPRRH